MSVFECFNCGKGLDEIRARFPDYLLGKVFLDIGYNGGTTCPSEPAYPYFICVECLEKEEGEKNEKK